MCKKSEEHKAYVQLRIIGCEERSEKRHESRILSSGVRVLYSILMLCEIFETNRVTVKRTDNTRSLRTRNVMCETFNRGTMSCGWSLKEAAYATGSGRRFGSAPAPAPSEVGSDSAERAPASELASIFERVQMACS